MMLTYFQMGLLIINIAFLGVIAYKVLKTQEKQTKSLTTLIKLIFAINIVGSVVCALYQSNVYQYHLANLILFYVGFSACLKACKADIKVNERKMGFFICSVVYAIIAVLLMVKPGGLLPV